MAVPRGDLIGDLPGALPGALLGVSLVVVLYCVARTCVPALRPLRHRRDLDAWHLVMAAAMAVMLLAGHDGALAVLGLLVFTAGVAWSVLGAWRRTGRAAYVRLGVWCAAMAVMLVPAATHAPAGAATATASGDAHATHHGHVASAAATGDGSLVPPSVLVVLLLAVLVALVVARLPGAVRRGVPAADRLDAGCEVLMGVVMAAMLAPLA